MTTFRSYGEAIAATRSALADAGFIHQRPRLEAVRLEHHNA